jgi:hypothetical protein
LHAQDFAQGLASIILPNPINGFSGLWEAASRNELAAMGGITPIPDSTPLYACISPSPCLSS